MSSIYTWFFSSTHWLRESPRSTAVKHMPARVASELTSDILYLEPGPDIASAENEQSGTFVGEPRAFGKTRRNEEAIERQDSFKPNEAVSELKSLLGGGSFRW